MDVLNNLLFISGEGLGPCVSCGAYNPSTDNGIPVGASLSLFGFQSLQQNIIWIVV